MTVATLPRVTAAGRPIARATFRVVARARLPTRHGLFEIVAFQDAESSLDSHHVAIVAGDPSTDAPVLARVHSSCMTGDVLGSVRCDCGAQLDAALEAIGAVGRGAVVYLQQEGRGIGLANKVRAYALQDAGADTVEANERLGFPADLRDFADAAGILAALGVSSVRLLTNNPSKVEALEKNGIDVIERVPIVRGLTPENRSYLETKRSALGHFLPGP